MKYMNAGDILPDHLLQELKTYAAGKLLYVPYDKERKTWGEVSGYRHFLNKRNQMIFNMFIHGKTIDHLSDEYCLSSDTIKKIVYSKKNKQMLDYHPSSASAIEYSNAGLLEEWIHTYLLFHRQNKVFSDGLRLFYRYYIGPVIMPLDLFKRSSGPEKNIKWRVDEVDFEVKVSRWIDRIKNGEDIPPFIINYEAGQFEINCNNPLFEAMKRLNITEYYIIIWITGKSDNDRFLKEYSIYI